MKKEIYNNIILFIIILNLLIIILPNPQSPIHNPQEAYII